MANVDKCERLCKKALCTRDIKAIASEIYLLNHNEKVNILKSKTVEQIENYLLNCSKFIKQSIFSKYRNKLNNENIVIRESSRNNKEGADLECTLPDGEIIEIEVKFGSKTDKGLGMKSFKEIFGSDIFSKTLSVSKRREFIKNFIAENYNYDKQLYRLEFELNKAVDEFNNYIKSINFMFTNKQQEILESTVLNNSGSNKNNSKNYIKFSFHSSEPKEEELFQTGIGKWKIEKTEKINIKENVKRVNIFVKNETTKLSIKFTLNWKNNYKIDKNMDKVPSYLGLNSPSWNVWVDKL